MSVLKTKSLLFARALPLVLTIIVFCGAVNAYTIVMRGGRQVEVPDHFLLTDSTLTYEVSPGIQITINVSAIDIPATEKVNKEAPGGFFRHRQIDRSSVLPRQTQSPNPAARTITNRDLQSLARQREESEQAYEKRRQELGLPRPNKIEASAAIDWEQRRAAELEQENYWRGRAEALRTEIAVVDAQLAEVQRALDRVANPLASASYTTLVNVSPFAFGNFGGQRHFGPRPRPPIFVGPQGPVRAGVVFRSAFPRQNFPAVGANSFAVFPPNVFLNPYPTYVYSFIPGELMSQINELSTTRAGLMARWRELEEEARRAGAPPGWLRP
jgi:hypothetical protein